MFYKTYFTLLDSFGHPVKHRPTLFFKTELDDVDFMKDPGSQHGLIPHKKGLVTEATLSVGEAQ